MRTTREGKAFILVTTGVGVAAFNNGNNLLYMVFGFLLSLIVLSGILSELVLRRLHIERRLPARVFAEATCLVEVMLRNDKRFMPSFSLEVEDLAADAPSERRCYFLKVTAGTEQRAIYHRTPSRRGLLHFTGFRVATRYPFGLFEKWRIIPATAELVVYPCLKAAPRPQHARTEASVERPDVVAGQGSELGVLREYRQGDEARRIHWRRSITLGRMVVRERERDTVAQLVIGLDNARPADASPQWEAAFEYAVSRAAALCLSGLAEGHRVELVTRDGGRARALPGSPADEVLRLLAHVAPVHASNELRSWPRTAMLVQAVP